MGVISAARPYLPGIAFLAVGAILSHLIAGAVDGLQPLVVAVGIGALVGNTAGTPDAAEPGVGVDKLFLETGIVLLGAAVVIEEFLAAGPTVLGLVVVAVGGGLLLAEAIARGLFRLDGTTPSLWPRARVSAASPRSSRSGACSTRGVSDHVRGGDRPPL